MSTTHKPIIFPFCFSVIQLFFIHLSIGQTLDVGAGYPFATLTDASEVVIPGDTIFVHEGIYNGGIFIADLQGIPSAWIYILAAEGETVIFDGGTNAWQFTDAAYLHISGFIFEHQLGNGLNFDDGGTYDTPAHHIIFESCTFRNITGTGNNDLLKLSGVDSFQIKNCLFLHGAAGGSGIDMVGCHDGSIEESTFDDLGSNSIQAKGGTRNIRIARNFFRNGGARAINLGGSTDLKYFRPIDAPYEAADLKVYANIFMGSLTPVAYVGCINTEVINNTIYLPNKWVLRILQETVDPDRFPPCGNNSFRNNILYLDDRVHVECDIGPNTAPETFTFSNNLWYHSDNTNWPGPSLPAYETDHIINQDPLFDNPALDHFNLMESSPAIRHGFPVTNPKLDYPGNQFLNVRSIGAYEGGMVTSVEKFILPSCEVVNVWPNPASGEVHLEFPRQLNEPFEIEIINQEGRTMQIIKLTGGSNSFSFHPSEMMAGYFIVYIKGINIFIAKKLLLF